MTMTASSIFALHQITPPPSSSAGAVATPGTSSGSNSKIVNGTVDDLQNGFGTFSKTMEEVNGAKTVDKTIIFANGQSKSSEKSVVLNDDGTKTITKTGKNGKTSTIHELLASNTDGSNTVTKEKTNAKGVTTESTSTISKNDDGSVDHQVTRTNAQGQTETLDRDVTKTNGTRNVVTNGTGYTGNTIYNETTWTTVV